MLQKLPMEYDTFKEMHTRNDQLPTYKAFKAKLLSKEIVLRFIAKDYGEVLAVEGRKNTFGNSKNH
jgi:hypothetical protein